ncbi:MAG: phage terminase large subunit family protein, partial [Phycisphaerae bacterium]|nr:phage terminase large subunit family protein [Phycisphaerae bacterium]
MIESGTKIFLQLPLDVRERILHPAIALAAHQQIWTAALEEDDVATRTDQDVLIFAEASRQFLQQPARIVEPDEIDIPALLEAEGLAERPTFSFLATGQPVSAENRKIYRVTTVMEGYTGRIGDREDCPIVDVSVAGFACITTETHHVGENIDVAIDCGPIRLAGNACVQSARDLGESRMRYGLRCLDERHARGNPLQRGLQ